MRTTTRTCSWCGLLALGCGLSLGGWACTRLLAEDGWTGGTTDAGWHDSEPGDGGSEPLPEAAADVVPDEAQAEAEADAEGGAEDCDPCSDPTLARLPCRTGEDGQGGETLVYATRTMRIGFGLETPDDWENLGLDRDCLQTTAMGEPTACLLQEPEKGKDGLAGRDNSFGLNFGRMVQFMKLAGLLDKDIEEGLNHDLEQGYDGWTLAIEGYDGEPDDSRVKVILRMSEGTRNEAGDTWVPAKWDGTDIWSYDPSSVSGDDDEPKFVDDNAYVVGDILVAKLMEGVPFQVQTEKGRLTLHLVEAVLMARLSEDRQQLEEGMISAIWPMAVAQDQLLLFAQMVGLCPPDPRIDVIMSEFEQAADIRIDLVPTPDLPCNGISFGMGFTAWRATLGGKADPQPELPNPCEDGGTADGG